MDFTDEYCLICCHTIKVLTFKKRVLEVLLGGQSIWSLIFLFVCLSVCLFVYFSVLYDNFDVTIF